MNYPDNTTITKTGLYIIYAPCFNFEYDEDELLALALQRGFISETGTDEYLINSTYKEGGKS